MSMPAPISRPTRPTASRSASARSSSNSWEQGRALTFVRNPYYWDQPKPYLDRVLVALIPNVQQQLNAVIQGEVDWMQFNDFSQVEQAQQACEERQVQGGEDRDQRARALVARLQHAPRADERRARAPGAVPGDRPPADQRRRLSRPRLPGDERDPRAVQGARTTRRSITTRCSPTTRCRRQGARRGGLSAEGRQALLHRAHLSVRATVRRDRARASPRNGSRSAST